MQVVAWRDLPDLGGVARLAGEPIAAVAAEHASFPPGVRGVALVEAGGVVASGVLVDREVGGRRYASMVRVRAREATAARPLLEALWSLANATGAAHVRMSVIEAPGLARLLSGQGFRVVDAFVDMHRSGPPHDAPLPAGLDEVPVDALDVDDFLAMRNAAFADTPGAFPFTREDWAVVTRGPAWDPDLLRILVEGGRPVAFHQGALHADRGEVDAIGVVPRARRRGLGRVLLRRCEARLAARGAPIFGLLVAASNGPALRLYRAEGYREVARRETWER